MDRYGLIGHPIGHSLSPRLFKAAYNGKHPYDLIETSDFEKAWKRFLDGYRAINVTAPFKTDAFARADWKSPECERCGATNLCLNTPEGVKAYNCFGMSEMNGPGVAFECQEQNGLHIWEDNVIVEIIDPETLEPVPEGEVGELVLTTINREAMPLLRYRTRDLTCILPGDCPCGRTHKRLARFKGRSDDMIILKGVNLFPIQIEKILMNFKELGSNYLITIETVGNSDEMLIEVELSDLFTDDYSALQRLTKEITRQLKDELLLTPRIRLVAKGSLPTGDGKAVRVKDLRKLC